MLQFKKSLPGILARQAAQAREEAAKILNPDTSNRLRFPSQGDSPRPKPQRSQFRTDEMYQAQLDHWTLEQKREAKIYERAIRSLT